MSTLTTEDATTLIRAAIPVDVDVLASNLRALAGVLAEVRDSRLYVERELRLTGMPDADVRRVRRQVLGSFDEALRELRQAIS